MEECQRLDEVLQPLPSWFQDAITKLTAHFDHTQMTWDKTGREGQQKSALVNRDFARLVTSVRPFDICERKKGRKKERKEERTKERKK